MAANPAGAHGAADIQVSPAKGQSSVEGSTSAGKGRDQSATDVSQLNTLRHRAQSALLCLRGGLGGGGGEQA